MISIIREILELIKFLGRRYISLNIDGIFFIAHIVDCCCSLPIFFFVYILKTILPTVNKPKSFSLKIQGWIRELKKQLCIPSLRRISSKDLSNRVSWKFALVKCPLDTFAPPNLSVLRIVQHSISNGVILLTSCLSWDHSCNATLRFWAMSIRGFSSVSPQATPLSS